MLQYETIFITDPGLQEEEIDALLKSYEQVTGAASGKVLKVEKWGKRRLAYPIGRHEEGIYVLMVLECPPESVKEIDRRYRMNDRILRHLTVRVEHEAQLGPSPMIRPRPAEREEIPGEAAFTP
ncbi:MAG TPA: 30S ribosomal protein S6 [Candidatus Polarisedimenticolia bacterium]|nr:30S ribosomal protein S6 [Candidatus Polarisedimenticolia bacterium]